MNPHEGPQAQPQRDLNIHSEPPATYELGRYSSPILEWCRIYSIFWGVGVVCCFIQSNEYLCILPLYYFTHASQRSCVEPTYVFPAGGLQALKIITLRGWFNTKGRVGWSHHICFFITCHLPEHIGSLSAQQFISCVLMYVHSTP